MSATAVHETRLELLQKHERPFEIPFKPGTPSFGGIAQALDRAKAENRVLVLGMHGGMAENGELQVMCDMRGVAYIGSGSASSYLAFDKNSAKRFAAIAGLKTTTTVALEDIEPAFEEHGRLIAKPARDGSSYGLIFVNAKQDLVAVRRAAATEEYLIEAYVAGIEATCGVLERLDGSLIALPPIEIIPAEGGAFDYEAKYIAKATQEICPGRFSPEVTAQLMECRDHGPQGAVVPRLLPVGLHHHGQGAGLSRDQHPAGPDQGLALSEGAEGARDRVRRFPERPDHLGRKAGSRQ